MTTERCSCGAREKSKCSKENGYNGGKMCLKDEDKLYINFRDTLNGGFCADIDYTSQAWQKVLSDWKGFSAEQVAPIPNKLIERIKVVQEKAEENILKEKEPPEIINISLEKSVAISDRGRAKILELYGDENKAFDELTAKLWDEHPEEMAEAKAWAQEFIEEIKRDQNN